MFHIHDLHDGLPLFRCLASPVRIHIVEVLQREGPLCMSDLAERVGITGGALTQHIKQLADCELVSISLAAGKHGQQRMCSANECHFLIDPAQGSALVNVYESEIGVGHYTGYQALPTCGLATADHIIGKEDDPRFFASPERINAAILWIGQGYFEYMIHNFLQPDQELIELQVSMELASEAPGSSEDWPSDIHFFLNGQLLCQWTSPADFARMRGIYTPGWWDRTWNQHGLFKLLTINDTGTFIDGTKRSDVTLGQLGITYESNLLLRIGVPEDAKNVGGLTLYGRGFGNYDQDIKVRMHYR